jgi:hypothetical protein
VPRHPYRAGTDHGERLTAVLDQFQRALTRRWREEVVRSAVGGYEITGSIRASTPRHGPVAWNHLSGPAHRHLATGDCSYVAWVESGQNGDLRAVSCRGWTGPDPPTQWINPATGEPEQVPPYIECGLGLILEQVEGWAWVERNHVSQRAPRFASQDLAVLHEAHDSFVRVALELGLEPGDNSHGTISDFRPMSEREITTAVQALAALHSDDQTWWDTWTGLAASTARAGIFASVGPTANNQAGILGALANLYAARAAIIEKGRRDTLSWIQWATKALDETAPVDITDGWLVVQGFGGGVSVAFGWTGAGALVGSALTLAGFLGEHLVPTWPAELNVHDLAAVVGRLNDEIHNLDGEISDLEAAYWGDIGRLREGINGIHSYNLELYDLTQNDPERDRPPRDEIGSVTADIGGILRIAELCYGAGELYAGFLPGIENTRQADPHLAGQDGQPTLADQQLQDIRDQLEGFLKTTSGRYLVAGDQVTAAARLYVEVDTSQADDFRNIMVDWERYGVGDFTPRFSPAEYARETDRPSLAPYWLPGEAPTTPGARDGRDYVTDRTSGANRG